MCIRDRKNRGRSVVTNAANLLIKFPTESNLILRNKNALDSKQYYIYSAKKLPSLDSSQNSYSRMFEQNDNKDENFLSLGIKISFSETSSSSAKTKGALGTTNYDSLMFVALRHEKPVFQSFQPTENSNVLYGPLVLLIKPAWNGTVLHEEVKGIRVEIDFPKTHHQSIQMKMGSMRKVFTKTTIVGNATYDNAADYHCVAWDARLNTFKQDSKHCQTLSLNETHTKCICTKPGRFAVVNVRVRDELEEVIKSRVNDAINDDYSNQGLLGYEDRQDENAGFISEGGDSSNTKVSLPDIDIEYDDTTFMVIVIAISSSVLVATILGIGLLVLYCKRVKVSFSMQRIPKFFNLLSIKMLRI